MSKKSIKNAVELNSFLEEVLIDLTEGKITTEVADSISKAVDKINKNNVNQLVYKKLTEHGREIRFFEES